MKVIIVMSLQFYKSEMRVILLLLMTILLTVACSSNRNSILLKETPLTHTKINLAHFNHLFTEINVANRKMAVVNIYSKYPNYEYAIEPAEGFACVDDVARAIIMLAQHIELEHDDDALQKLKMLTEFILYMQNENGYFNNFIWQDLSINTSYKTSTADMNWWSFRALWSLQVAYEKVHADLNLRSRIESAINKLIANIKRDIPITGLNLEVVNTITIPSWLPNKYAADQSALAIIALLPYYQKSNDSQVLAIINVLAKGIIQMQKGDADNYPYGMFLSWKNQWHSWGNSQAYALLLAGQQLGHQQYIQSALLEIDNFYPYMLKNGLAESIWIEQKQDGFFESNKKRFPQIAYGIRPMVYALSEAFKITKNHKYIILREKFTAWLFGNNDASKRLYHEENGRTYDAIVSADEINKNSGAESTIEGLLILQMSKIEIIK